MGRMPSPTRGSGGHLYVNDGSDLFIPKAPELLYQHSLTQSVYINPKVHDPQASASFLLLFESLSVKSMGPNFGGVEKSNGQDRLFPSMRAIVARFIYSFLSLPPFPATTPHHISSFLASQFLSVYAGLNVSVNKTLQGSCGGDDGLKNLSDDKEMLLHSAISTQVHHSVSEKL